MYIADSNFDIDDIISLGSESIYISITDQDGNLNGGSADSLTGLVVSCATDSEAITLTETGAATEVFRNAGLTTALYTGSATNNNGTLTCADSVTITATYTDPQDSGDTRTDTATSTGDTIPTAPSSFAGSAASTTSITWTWTDNASDETGFKLYDSSNTLIATISTANTTSYTETGLTASTSYTRKIAAYNGAGNSSYSSSATVTTDAAATPTPTPTPTPSTSTTPTAPSLVSPANESLTNDNLPTFTFKKSTVDNATISSYTLTVGTLTFTGIPANGNSASNPASKTHSTDKYSAQYFNEGSTSTTSQTIAVTLKDYGTADVPLNDGTYTWYVTAIDNAGESTRSNERTVIIDATNPTISNLRATNPTLTATLKDNRALQEATVTLAKANTLLGAITSYTALETRTYTLLGKTYALSFTPRRQLDKGESYRYTVVVTDSAGNTTQETKTLTVLSDQEAAQEAVAQLNPETDSTDTIIETLRDLLPENPINLGAFQEQAVVRRQLQAINFQRFLDPILAWLFNGTGVLERTLVAVLHYMGTIIDTTTTHIASWFERIVRIAMNIVRSTVAYVGDQYHITRMFLASIDFAAPMQILSSKVAIQHQSNIALLNVGITTYNKGVTNIIIGTATITESTLHAIGTLNPMPAIRASTNYIARMFEQGRDTRIRQGLANRQSVDTFLRRVIDPVAKNGRKLVAFTRHGYELFFANEPTQISNVKISSLQPTSAVIEWDTNHLARFSKVNYGTSTTYDKEAKTSLEYADHHRIEITDLSPETTYYFEVMSQNGEYVFDAYYAVTTPPRKDADAATGQASGQAPQPQEIFIPQEATIISDTPVAVLDEPQPNAKEIGSVNPKETYRALKEAGDWISLLLPNGQEGWIKKEFVSLRDQVGVSAEGDRSTIIGNE